MPLHDKPRRNHQGGEDQLYRQDEPGHRLMPGTNWLPQTPHIPLGGALKMIRQQGSQQFVIQILGQAVFFSAEGGCVLVQH
jgi:hypothetical protein